MSSRLLVLSAIAFCLLITFDPVECREESFVYLAPSCRKHSVSITDFGGVGDGVTVNTNAFRNAVAHLAKFSTDGGGQLYVPPGRWLTGPFNLTSAFTLYLHRDAVILASQDISQWPLIDALPSYGRGRDAPGGRYSSLISGTNLSDVVITGDNGTIDGQGEIWWKMFRSKQLNYTRGYLVELMHSDGIVISNLTFVNSTAWNIHPVYSRNIIVKGVTILASLTSPNTDGINPDSCSHVRIEDCYIVSGDDCIAIKSGWDQYGIAFGMPSKHIYIRRLTCISPTSAVIALGSEMSGGIRDVYAEDIVAINSETGVRIKTAPGRGGFIKKIYVRGMTMHTMKWVFGMTGAYGQHPDDKYDPNALPVVKGICYSNMIAHNVTTAGKLLGIPNAPFTHISISNVTITMASGTSRAWNCSNITGKSRNVTPQPCSLLPAEHGRKHGDGPCHFPKVKDITDHVKFKVCTYKSSHVGDKDM
ncbi:putative polygalacturonase [Nymphaea thermarum]|nr:putative polygalacturonase [Nymphaea thermarum]